jgi:hypothetical protein
MPSAAEATAAHPGLTYLERLDDAFELAVLASTGLHEHSFDIAGRGVRLRFAGAALARALTPALAHHPAAAADADHLTVCVFDAASTGVSAPPFPWDPTDVRERGEVRGFNDDRVRTLYETDSGMLSMIDLERRRAYLVVDERGRLLWWQRAAPLRSILHWGLGSPTTHLVHAAAVGTAHGGVLLAGAGGSGKSTTAVACAAAGFGYAGDDYALLDVAGGPVVHSLYATAKVTGRGLTMLPELSHALLPGSLEDEKHVIDMARAFPDRIARALPVDAIVLPRVAPGAVTCLERASAADALRALAPTTIYQLPSNGGLALRPLADLARRAPVYALTLGDEPTGPSLIAGLLEGRDD